MKVEPVYEGDGYDTREGHGPLLLSGERAADDVWR